ncbi:MAG: Txe/YoeB family addiction module toxin [Sphingobacteriaceae bacterium]|nr:Txe/YoeB family addiction module toxin [Sphingobacteriaceae bacterium]
MGNKTILTKIFVLLDEIYENPFSGTGKPEALKYHLSGAWSRRINKEHRMVYSVQDDVVTILSLKGHY